MRPELEIEIDAVLDSEALSVLARPKERGASMRRAQVVLEAIHRAGGVPTIPAPVLAEVVRGRRAAAVDRVVRIGQVVPTDRPIAERAGQLLEGAGLGSAHAVDAFVVATAATVGPCVILTGDLEDLGRLAVDLPGVAVRSLR